MSLDGKIEESKSVAAERVRAALEDDRLGAIAFHHLAHDGLEELFVTRVIDAVTEWNIHRMEFPLALTNVIEIASTGEELTELVKAHCHHPVIAFRRTRARITHHKDDGRKGECACIKEEDGQRDE